MTDPFSALSAAGAIIHITDLAARMLYRARQFYQSVDGSLVEHREIRTVTEAFLENARSTLRRRDIRNGSRTDRQLYLLCRDSEKIAKELLETLESLRLGRSPTLPEAVRCALKSSYERNKITDLEARLDRYRRQIDSTTLCCIHDHARSNNRGRDRQDRLRSFDDLSEDDTRLRADSRPTRSRNRRQADTRADVSIFPRILPEAVEVERGLSTRRNIPGRLPSLNIDDSNSDGESQQRPIQLPSDIEERFAKIFDPIDSRRFEQASTLFRLARAASHEFPLSLLLLSFAEDGFESAMRADIRPLKKDQVLHRTETVRRRLDSRCQDLLEAPKAEVDGGDAVVQYRHGTVLEYLQRNDVWDRITSSRKSFNPNLALCGAYLRQIKTVDFRHDRGPYDRFWTGVALCLHYAKQIDDHRRTREFLDEVDRVGRQLITSNQTGNSWSSISPATTQSILSPRGDWIATLYMCRESTQQSCPLIRDVDKSPKRIYSFDDLVSLAGLHAHT